eukprot:7189980-Pyramimonas_sp.AAC.1
MNNVGQPVVSKESLIYLGASLSANGIMGAEMSGGVGSARRYFSDIAHYWISFCPGEEAEGEDIQRVCVVQVDVRTVRGMPQQGRTTAYWTAFRIDACERFSAYSRRSSTGCPTPVS